MIVKYGDYSFANGECSMVNFQATAKRTPRNVRRSTIVRADCAGEFCFSGPVDQDAIKTKITAAKAALDVDYKDFELIHNDGTTRSPYVLYNSEPTNISGNLVMAVRWPSEMPEDYATTKQFMFTIQAEFVNPSTFLLDWRQSLYITGTAGKVAKWERYLNETWFRRLISASSTKKIIQQGYAIGFGSYPLPATPILSTFYEHEEHRQIDRIGPSLFYRRPEEFVTRWRYVFESPLEFTPVNIYPPLA